MIECLIKCDELEMPYTGEQFEEAIHPSVPHTKGPGKWTIDLGEDRFVDFSPEPPGIQISFDDGIDQELAEKVANDVVKNLVKITGRPFYPLWL